MYRLWLLDLQTVQVLAFSAKGGIVRYASKHNSLMRSNGQLTLEMSIPKRMLFEC